MTTPPRPDDDPRPEPPERPDNNACCQSGCDPCIFDLYDEEVGRWRAAVAAWEAREAARREAAEAAAREGAESKASAKPARTKAARKPA
jgi:hypothetical protein